LYLRFENSDFGMLPKRFITAAYSITLLLFFLPRCANAQTQPAGNPVEGRVRAETVFKVGGNVTAPKAVFDPNPEYSEEARSAHVQGTCELRLVVGSDGSPRDIRILRPLGSGLDENAVRAVRTWKFEPARRDGNPVASEVAIELSFSLDKDDAKIRDLLAEVAALAPPRPTVSTRVEPCTAAHPSQDRPKDGSQITISDLNIEGAQLLSVADQEQIVTSLIQRSYTGNVDGVTSEVLERVRAAWQDRGYFKVEVTGDAKMITSNAVSGRIALTVHVSEGQQYRLGHITFKNNTFLRAKALRDIFPLQDGEVFSREKVAQGLDAIRKAFGEMGYINITPFPDAKFDDENMLVSLDINLDAGKQFFISAINIIGSDEQAVEMASKDLWFQPADVYNGRYVEMFLHQHASLLNAAPDSNSGLLHLDEKAGTVAITFDLRHCRVQ
jgi:TonB family protein